MAAVERPTHWQLRTRAIDFCERPRVMGILNVTPDSFSDGGQFFATQSAIDRGLRMEDEGADLIDVGGESTRPYSEPVSVQDELRRVLPVIEGLASRLEIPLSIDTSKAIVAQSAIEAGAEIINDVTGLTGDPGMADVAVGSQAGICVMHMQGTPQTMQDDPQYGDVVDEIHRYLQQRLSACVELGIRRDRICLDPGIGFGKTHQHNLQLLAAANRFLDLGQPILVGHSRKGFIAHVLNDKETDRLYGTLAVSLALAAKQIDLLRVHDVRPTVQGLQLFKAAGGIPVGT